MFCFVFLKQKLHLFNWLTQKDWNNIQVSWNHNSLYHVHTVGNNTHILRAMFFFVFFMSRPTRLSEVGSKSQHLTFNNNIYFVTLKNVYVLVHNQRPYSYCPGHRCSSFKMLCTVDKVWLMVLTGPGVGKPGHASTTLVYTWMFNVNAVSLWFSYLSLQSSSEQVNENYNAQIKFCFSTILVNSIGI